MLADIAPAGGKKWSRTACEFMEDEVHNAKMYIQKRVCKIFFFFENVFILLNM